MNKQAFLGRLDQLIEEGLKLANEFPSLKEVDPIDQKMNTYIKTHVWRLGCSNLLRNYFGVEHQFYKNFNKSFGRWHRIEDGIKQPIEYCREDICRGYAVLVHIKKEIKLGFVSDAQHLYESNLFSNILEQAFELVEKNYLVGATVYSRLIIENFINDLCRTKKIDLEEKDKLPQKLTKLREKEAIDLPQERMIQASYDIGTFAVHGKEEFKNYTKERVKELLEDIRNRILIIK